MTYTVDTILSFLKDAGNEKMKKHHLKAGAGKDLFGVQMGEIRKLANKIKVNHNLALDLWATGNMDARFLAVLLMDNKRQTVSDLRSLITSEKYTYVIDWMTSYVIKVHPEMENIRRAWLHDEHLMINRVAWSLTAHQVNHQPEQLDIPAIMNEIENNMARSAPEVQWTMNTTLAQIGIKFPEYRENAISIGEKIGLYKDFPVSKGCTSPYAPIWIEALIRKNNQKS